MRREVRETGSGDDDFILHSVLVVLPARDGERLLGHGQHIPVLLLRAQPLTHLLRLHARRRVLVVFRRLLLALLLLRRRRLVGGGQLEKGRVPTMLGK